MISNHQRFQSFDSLGSSLGPVVSMGSGLVY